MTFVDALIYLHAGGGGVALLAGAMALFVKKGGGLHRTSGKVFFYAMLLSALLSLLIAVLPGHLSPFLFSLGVLTSYLLVSGYLSLRYQRSGVKLGPDRALAFTILLTGVAMLLHPLYLVGAVNPVLLVFGGVSAAFGLRDMYYFRDPIRLQTNWLRIHLAKMTGAYIASVTAFLVVNDTLPGLWNWFLPLVVGTSCIIYWIRKVRRGAVLGR